MVLAGVCLLLTYVVDVLPGPKICVDAFWLMLCSFARSVTPWNELVWVPFPTPDHRIEQDRTGSNLNFPLMYDFHMFSLEYCMGYRHTKHAQCLLWGVKLNL